MKHFLRAVQTHVPFLHDLRFRLKLKAMRCFRKPHEHDFHALTLFGLTDKDLLLDVGSNRGEAIASMQAVLGSNNKIVGFEPNPMVHEKVVTFFKKDSNVFIHNLGMGKESGSFKLYLPYYRKWMFDGLASFKKQEAADWLKSRLWNFREKHFSIKEVVCTVGTLDELDLSPKFIKIDVQGFEYEVLLGGVDTIRTCHPIILLEDITKEIKEFLTPMGYQFYTYKNGKLTKGEGTLNTFCLHKWDTEG